MVSTFNYAAIDVGSNSINLLVASVEKGVVTDEKTYSFITRLGDELSSLGKFSVEGMSRAIEAFEHVYQIINDNNILEKNIICVATEASRVASNSADFFNTIKEKYSIGTNIISAKDEANYSVRGAVPVTLDETLLLDLGGASSEIIHYRFKKIVTYKSFKLGAVNISSEFSIEEMENFISSLNYNSNIILVGGTAATIAACYLGQTNFLEEEIDRLQMEPKELFVFEAAMRALSREKLIEKFPLAEKRIHSINMGINNICNILRVIKPKNIMFSTRGVRHGALLSLIEPREITR